MIKIQRIVILLTYNKCTVDWIVYILTTLRSEFCVLHDFLFPSFTIVMNTDRCIRLAKVFSTTDISLK